MTLSHNLKTVIFILIAFIFSFSVRLIWVDHFSTYEQFKFNNEFMINTNDGYYFAEGARDIIAGFHQENDLSPVDDAMSKLTALLVQILPLSFETVIFYMPAFFGSLLVIPLILIGRSFDKEDVGFIAALLASIAWSYYNRTMVGYYDTDMLVIVFASFLLWALLWAVRTKEDKYLLFTGLIIIFYKWWYSASYSLSFAFLLLIGLYFLYLILKKKEFEYELKLMIFILASMVLLPLWVSIVLIVTLYFGLKYINNLKVLFGILGLGIILLIATGGLNPIILRIEGYLFRSNDVVSETLTLHFFSVMQTVREAGAIPFETFANRISGNIIVFFLSIIGYIWFSVRHKEMLLALPLVGLGFLAYGIPGLVNAGGLRFTIYAVPVMALGIGFLIIETLRFVTNLYLKEKQKTIAFLGLASIATAAILYPNIKHVQEYKVPTVFTKNEVKILDDLKKITEREDYVVTWWDYGYPIRFYSDVKTLVDGGKHSGAQNFPVSFVLTSSQEVAAKMARLEVEYKEKRFQMHKANKKMEPSSIAQMTLDYGYKDTNNFLTALETDIKLPTKTRDVYIYLPNKMMGIFPTVNLFSNLDLMNGMKYKRPLFYMAKRFKDNGATISLGNGIQIYKQTGEIQLGNQKLKMNSFITTGYDQKKKLKVNSQKISFNSPIYVIYMQSYNQFLILDKQMYDSLYIQLFVLENYDKKLFEPVILNPFSKVYKLKI
jgi:dolichyl-diphosphooligosaccharide--protein glycosyltransferase/undecaprenyl-diphosphooligosaccharide--protein glycosyltransferase